MLCRVLQVSGGLFQVIKSRMVPREHHAAQSTDGPPSEGFRPRSQSPYLSDGANVWHVGAFLG